MPILLARSALGNISRLTQSGLAVLVRPRARQIIVRFLFLDVVIGVMLGVCLGYDIVTFMHLSFLSFLWCLVNYICIRYAMGVHPSMIRLVRLESVAGKIDSDESESRLGYPPPDSETDMDDMDDIS